MTIATGTLGRRRLVTQLYEGCIAGSAFGDGETVVVGLWRRSPIGPFVDVFWVRPDGKRILLTARSAVVDTAATIYRFDHTEVVPLRGGWDGEQVRLDAGPLRLRLDPGRRDWRSWLFALRPRPLRRSTRWLQLEDRFGRPLVGRLIGGARGVRAAGTAPGGQREWYGVDDWRPVVSGSLFIHGRDAGPLRSLPADLRIGLSSFPTMPALVFIGTLVEAVAPLPAEPGRGGTLARPAGRTGWTSVAQPAPVRANTIRHRNGRSRESVGRVEVHVPQVRGHTTAAKPRYRPTPPGQSCP